MPYRTTKTAEPRRRSPLELNPHPHARAKEALAEMPDAMRQVAVRQAVEGPFVPLGARSISMRDPDNPYRRGDSPPVMSRGASASTPGIAAGTRFAQLPLQEGTLLAQRAEEIRKARQRMYLEAAANALNQAGPMAERAELTRRLGGVSTQAPAVGGGGDWLEDLLGKEIGGFFSDLFSF